MPDLVTAPDHVPAELVRNFDFAAPPGFTQDVHAAWKQAQEQLPPLFWTPHYGGHWVVTDSADIQHIQTHGDLFSHRVVSLPRDTKPVLFVPLELDEPEHTPYRKFLNPWFSPRVIRDLEPAVRKLAGELIAGFAARGRCEFLSEFAQHLPVIVFLGIVGLPLEEREKFLEWVGEAARAVDADARRVAFGKAAAYLGGVLAERRDHPGDDLLSQIAITDIDGRRLEDHQALGMAMLVFFGGLDTVVNMMCFIMHHLALHPDQQRLLAQHPDRIPRAVEEMIRRHGVANTSRLVTRDLDLRGIRLRQGDVILAPNMFIGLDEDKFPNPLEIELDRKTVTHGAFGNGPHRCVGANLARSELRIFLEEWLKCIPAFAIAAGTTVMMRSGAVCGIEGLPLVWDASDLQRD